MITNPLTHRRDTGTPADIFPGLTPEEVLAETALRDAGRLAQATLDALSAHIAVLDDTGLIIAVNRAWRDFEKDNPQRSSNVNEGTNYLAVCDAARLSCCRRR